MAHDAESGYLRENGVLLRPGTRVWCSDRDLPIWEQEGTIVAIIGDGEYKVDFGRGTGGVYDLSWRSISPTREEIALEEAVKWREASKLRVFLCHASEDKEAVHQLYQCLVDWGFRPWLDTIDIGPGEEWDPAIRRAVVECHVVLVCLSRRSVEKTGYVQKEIRVVLERADEMPEGRVYVIPLRLEDHPLPRRLEPWQRLDLFAPEGYERLHSALQSSAERLELE